MSEENTQVVQKRSKWLWIGAIAAVIVILYAGMAYALTRSIPVGTSLAGVNLAGLSSTEASEKLLESSTTILPESITVKLEDATFSGTAAEFGVELDAAATIDQIQLNPWNPFEIVGQLFVGNSVQPVFTVSEKFENSFEKYALDLVTAPVSASADFTVNPPVVIESVMGKGLDTAIAREQLETSLAENAQAKKHELTLDYVEVKPELQTADVTDFLAGDYQTIVSAQVVVSADGGSKVDRYSPFEIRNSIYLVSENGNAVAHLDPEKLGEVRDPNFISESQPVQNATWDVSSGTPVVVPSKAGFGITNESLAKSIESVWLNPKGQRTVDVEFGVIEPEFTTEEAESMGITELVSSYTQNFEYLPYRVTNIGQAAEYIDGTLLKPGEEYSMNDTIKERTYANGYVDGYIIAPGGIFRMEPGGGVSAATTTMFNGAWFAGLKFLEWRAHSVYISRYPAGREATVFWGQLDMRFRNSHPTGIFITTYMTNSSMTVKFWGTKQWDEVGSVSGPYRNSTSYDTVYSEEESCSTQTGVNGFAITVYRTFINDGVEVKREAFNTTYRPTPRVVCGSEPTKKPKPTKTKTPKPTPTETPTETETPPAE